jgi:mannose-1-phosphate guanylyltransferase / mannose-6-phosphate isomerase
MSTPSPTFRTTAVILCGGAGSRLWPLSTAEQPKQFHALAGKYSLLAQTVLRAQQMAHVSDILIVASISHAKLLSAHVTPFTGKPVHMLLEPLARNTAPAIASAAAFLAAQPGYNAQHQMIVMPSDHWIPDTLALEASLLQAAQGAALGRLMTLGIKPLRPETGYGYIHEGAPIAGTDCHEVQRFVEKPHLERAQEMLAHGGYLWNSGIFVFQTDSLLSELQAHAPQIAAASREAVQHGLLQGAAISLHEARFAQCESISVDYAVFERSRQVATVCLDTEWNDLGSWDAISKAASPSSGHGTVIDIDSHNHHVLANKPVAIIGVDDLIVVDTPTGLLICRKGQSQQVGQVSKRLSSKPT